MTYRLEVRPEALSDIEDAARWYDEQRSGLGTEFTGAVVEAIDVLPNHPLSIAFATNERTFAGS